MLFDALWDRGRVNLDVRRLAARFNAVVVPFGSIGSADNARELRRVDGSSHTKPKSLALGGRRQARFESAKARRRADPRGAAFLDLSKHLRAQTCSARRPRRIEKALRR